MNCSSYSKNAMVLKVRGYTRFLTHSIYAKNVIIYIYKKITKNIFSRLTLFFAKNLFIKALPDAR